MTEEAPRKRRKARWLRFALAMLISVAIVLALCLKTQTKLADVFTKLLEVDVFFLTLAFGISGLIHIVLGGLKWFLILVWAGYRTTFVEALFVRMGSDPLRAVMPFKTGELGNAAYYWRTGRMTFGESLSWVAFDKALNIGGTFFWLAVGLGVMFAGGVPASLREHSRWVAVGAGLVAFSTAVLFAPLLSARFRGLCLYAAGLVSGKLRRFGERALAVFARVNRLHKFVLVLVGIVFQLRPLIVCVLLFQAFRPDFARMPSLPEFVASGSVVVAFSNVPGPQWGTGPRETALAVLFHDTLEAPPPFPEDAPDPLAGDVVALDSGAGTLIAIGLLMAVAIHLVPAFFGLPFLVQFLNALRVGKAPPLDGPEDEEEEGQE